MAGFGTCSAPFGNAGPSRWAANGDGDELGALGGEDVAAGVVHLWAIAGIRACGGVVVVVVAASKRLSG